MVFISLGTDCRLRQIRLPFQFCHHLDSLRRRNDTSLLHLQNTLALVIAVLELLLSLNGRGAVECARSSCPRTGTLTLAKTFRDRLLDRVLQVLAYAPTDLEGLGLHSQSIYRHTGGCAGQGVAQL